MEFFTIILEKSSSRQVLPDNFVKMLDGHRPQIMKLRQAGNGLRKLWDVEVVFDTDGSMYLDRGWKQFVHAYDLRHGYFLVFRYDGNATFAVKNMKLRHAGNGLRKLWDMEVAFDTDGSMYLDRGWKQFVRAYDLRHGYFLVFRCYVYGSSNSGYSKSSSDSGYSKSSSDDGLAMVIPQLGDRAMPILYDGGVPDEILCMLMDAH
ncbi:B3 domain-containing protein [Hordeum vulgare]|nr:B3 domain-containing protein [Hordeum vulgare]